MIQAVHAAPDNIEKIANREKNSEYFIASLQELDTEKSKVYLPDLSETVDSANISNKIDEKSISAPGAEIKH